MSVCCAPLVVQSLWSLFLLKLLDGEKFSHSKSHKYTFSDIDTESNDDLKTEKHHPALHFALRDAQQHTLVHHKDISLVSASLRLFFCRCSNSHQL